MVGVARYKDKTRARTTPCIGSQERASTASPPSQRHTSPAYSLRLGGDSMFPHTQALRA